MDEKIKDIFKGTVMYQMRGSEAEFRAVEARYAKKLTQLYELREEEKRKAEESLKDFMITF